MKIEKISYYNIQPPQRKVNFKAASDITIEYVLKKHIAFLPERITEKVRQLISEDKSDTTLQEVHNEVYKKLFESKTLEEVKNNYSEFSEIIDVTNLSDNRSKAIKAIRKVMPLEDFTLDYLKKLYKPTSQEKLVEEYGFTNRNLLFWLNEKLNIKKLSGSYIQLLKMSNEAENNRIAELSRQAIYANAEAQKYRLTKAAEAHRTPEYRAKKTQEMKDYYKRNPQTAKRTSIISKLTWDRCPEIKKALSEYTKKLSPYIKKILSKKQTGAILNAEEKRVVTGYYKGFWRQYSHLKSIYQRRRLEVIDELKKLTDF